MYFHAGALRAKDHHPHPAMLLLRHALHCPTLGVGDRRLNPFIAAALYLMYEIGRLVGEKTTADKFPEAKKAAVQRSRSVLGGMFAEQLAPYLPNFPFSPTEAKFIGAPIDFLVFKGMDDQHIEEVIFVEVKSGSARLNHNEHSLKDAIKTNVSAGMNTAFLPPSLTSTPQPNPRFNPRPTG